MHPGHVADRLHGNLNSYAPGAIGQVEYSRATGEFTVLKVFENVIGDESALKDRG